jgi:hypothetical protein
MLGVPGLTVLDRPDAMTIGPPRRMGGPVGSDGVTDYVAGWSGTQSKFPASLQLERGPA